MSHKERKGKKILKCKEPKNVEHCFGVLQKARFAIIQNLSRQWDMATIESILVGCVTLHNLNHRR